MHVTMPGAGVVFAQGHVHDDRAVDVAFAGGEVVDADRGQQAGFGHRQLSEQTQRG
jgi:hypothetical protein